MAKKILTVDDSPTTRQMVARTLPEYKIAPILVLTTASGDEMKARGSTAGATGWMTNPFDVKRAGARGQESSRLKVTAKGRGAS